MKKTKDTMDKGAKKEKKPKFKLLSYTLKAVIPVGQYANIQPEITVQALTIEAAERAVMPYIETLFAKYRDGGIKPIEPVVVKPVAPVAPKPVPPINTTAPKTVVTPPVAPVVSVVPEIPLTVPYNRAKGAIESCMSLDALTLVSDQIEKSTKLIDTEKVELKKLIDIKHAELIPKTHTA